MYSIIKAKDVKKNIQSSFDALRITQVLAIISMHAQRIIHPLHFLSIEASLYKLVLMEDLSVGPSGCLHHSVDKAQGSSLR